MRHSIGVILLWVLFSNSLSSQDLQVISNASGFSDNGRLYFALGESFIGESQNDDVSLSIGFYQAQIILNAIDNPIEGLSAKIYPNPTADQVMIELEKGVEPLEAKLVHSSGMILHTYQIQGSQFLNVGEFPAGMYYLILADKQGRKANFQLTIVH